MLAPSSGPLRSPSGACSCSVFNFCGNRSIFGLCASCSVSAWLGKPQAAEIVADRPHAASIGVACTHAHQPSLHKKRTRQILRWSMKKNALVQSLGKRAGACCQRPSQPCVRCAQGGKRRRACLCETAAMAFTACEATSEEEHSVPFAPSPSSCKCLTGMLTF